MSGHGYRLQLVAVQDGREHWGVACECGWYQHSMISRRAAELALKQHRHLKSVSKATWRAMAITRPMNCGVVYR